MKDSAKRYVYADNAATTAVSPQVVEAMLPYTDRAFWKSFQPLYVGADGA